MQSIPILLILQVKKSFFLEFGEKISSFRENFY